MTSLMNLLSYLLFIAPHHHAISFVLPSYDIVVKQQHNLIRGRINVNNREDNNNNDGRVIIAGVVKQRKPIFASSNSVTSSSIHNESRRQPSFSPTATTTSAESSLRRTFLQKIIKIPAVVLPLHILLIILPTTTPQIAHAAEANILLRGTVTLSPRVFLPEESPSGALYITARPNTPDNVPRAILDGSRGKPPPVLAARMVVSDNRSFPFAFRLTTSDLTIEGKGSSSSSEGDKEDYWWAGEDLIVSARWDTDGIAATRDPSDLVGRGMAKAKDVAVSGASDVDGDGVVVPLQGRGFTGKLVTGKSKRG